MTSPFHGNPAREARDRRGTFAQTQPDRNGAMQVFQAIQHLLTEVFNRQTSHLSSQPLKSFDRFAVVEACAEIVMFGCSTEIQVQRQVDAEPLPIATLMLQHAHMGPKA